MKRICLIVSQIKKGFSQKEVATAVGITQQALAKYELGVSTPSSFRIINELAKLLNSPKERLFPDIYDKKGCDDCAKCSNSKTVI